MWLLRTDLRADGIFLPVLEEHDGQNLPAYAILSHTWGEGEVLFEDVMPDPHKALTKKSFLKVAKAAERARDDGYQYVWVDTCCIRKDSSTELQEAINSMFNWYKMANVCYAYLADFREHLGKTRTPQFRVALRDSRWFTRGWTLQELLAPLNVVFYSSNWEVIGTKASLANLITAITSIDTKFLLDPKLIQSASVAKRMSWASQRQTRRVEDTAYCLMGIFSVNMPMLYGEGENAFLRLQQEIWERHEDQSLFLWTDPDMDPDTPHGLLADGPAAFYDTGDFCPYENNQGRSDVEIISKGVRTTLRMQQKEGEDYFVASFECPSDSKAINRATAGVYLRPLGWGVNQYVRVRCNQISDLPRTEGSPLFVFVPQQADQKKAEQVHYPLDILFLRDNIQCSDGGAYYLADMLVCDRSGQELPRGNEEDSKDMNKHIPNEMIKRGNAVKAKWVLAPFSSLVEGFERRKLLVVLLFCRRMDNTQFAIMLTTDHLSRLAFSASETTATHLQICSRYPVQLTSCPSISTDNLSSLPADVHIQGCHIRVKSQIDLSADCKCLCIDFGFRVTECNKISRLECLAGVRETRSLVGEDEDSVPKIPLVSTEMALTHHWQCSSTVELIAFSRCGKLIACTCHNGSTWLYSTKETIRLADVFDALGLSFFDNQRFAIVGRYRFLTHCNPILSTSTQDVLHEDDHHRSFSLAVFSSEGRRVITQESGSNGRVTIWNTASRRLVRRFGNRLGHISRAKFSADGRQIGLVMADGTCMVRDSITGAACLRLENDRISIKGLSFSPNGKFIATAHGSGVLFWNRRTGAPCARLSTKLGTLQVAFSASGDCVTVVPISRKPFFVRLPDHMCAAPDAEYEILHNDNRTVSPNGKQIAISIQNPASSSAYMLGLFSYPSEGENMISTPKGNRSSLRQRLFGSRK